MKIRFVCNWDDSININNRVVSNYITDDNYDSDIILTSGSDYDYLFVFNKLNIIPNIPKERIFTFIMEPSWSPNWDRNCFNYSNKVFVHDKNLFGNYDNIIECPSYMFYHMDYKNNTIKELLNNNNFDKKNKINMVVSYNPNYQYKNYKLRTDLALKLLQYNFDVDIYGRGWNINNKRVKGPVINKYDALIDYQYSIAIENSCEKNYVTEKFFDISLCNAIPIYYGSPNISEIYDHYEKINLLNINECLDKITDIINNNDFDIEKIKENKLKYFNKYNIYNKVKELINEFN